MKRMFTLAVVLSLVSWIVPLAQAQAISPAGLISGLAGLALNQPKIEKPKVEQPKNPKTQPDKEIKPAKEQPKPEVIPQPKPEMKAQPVPPPPPAVPAQQYCERTVVCYKPVMVERVVKQVVTKLVPREEKFTCTVFVPVIKEVKRLETFCVPVQKPVEYTTTILVPVTTNEKRKITECTLVKQEMDVKYTVMVPKMVKEKRVICYTELQKQLVQRTIPTCQTVTVPVTDCCGNSYNVCQVVMVPKQITCEVCVPIRKTKEVLVDVTICEPQFRVGKTYVCKPVFTEKEIIVPVTRCVAEKRVVKGTVCEMVPQTREVVCKVQSCVPEQRVVTRTVMHCQSELVSRKVQCVEMVPYTTVERIPIIVSSCCRPCW